MPYRVGNVRRVIEDWGIASAVYRKKCGRCTEFVFLFYLINNKVEIYRVKLGIHLIFQPVVGRFRLFDILFCGFGVLVYCILSQANLILFWMIQ